jgi:hypothetical protein
MKFTYFAFVLAFLALPVWAQNKKNAPVQSSTSVLINGQPLKGKVLEMDGKHFVAIEDLAQSLRGTIAYGDGQIALTLTELPVVAAPVPSPQPATRAAQQPSPQPPAVPAQVPAVVAQLPTVPPQPAGAGGIQGTLTYFVDFHVGNKPDAGSKIWLVKGRVEIPADQAFVGTSAALGTGENPEKYSAIQYSVADGNGKYELHDVPPGEYTLVLQSAHTVGALNEKRNLFGRGNGRAARDSKGRIELLNVKVKPGETVEAPKDFGPNIDM